MTAADTQGPAAASHLDQAELQVVQASASVPDLHRQLSAGLAAMQCNAGRHSSAPSLQHIGEFRHQHTCAAHDWEERLQPPELQLVASCADTPLKQAMGSPMQT